MGWLHHFFSEKDTGHHLSNMHTTKKKNGLTLIYSHRSVFISLEVGGGYAQSNARFLYARSMSDAWCNEENQSVKGELLDNMKVPNVVLIARKQFFKRFQGTTSYDFIYVINQ